MNTDEGLRSTYRCCWLIGSSGGIGSALIPLLSGVSEQLVLCDVKIEDNNSSRLLERGNQVHSRKVDFSDDASSEEFVSSAVKSFGKPDLMIIAAGLVKSEDILATSIQAADSLYQQNLRLVFIALKRFLENCIQDPEVSKSVVIFSSNAAILNRPDQAFYACLKAAICSLASSAALQYGKWGVRINCVAPGTVWVNRNDDRIRKSLSSPPNDPSRPLGKILLPDDLIKTVRLLIDKNGLITGQTLVIDGGSSL